MAAPLGRVSLVFTDVQGSTSLWDHHTEAMRAALDVHNATFRAVLERHGGYEVKTEGDAFMVAFADCTAAVAFCLEAQGALLRAAWPSAILAAADAREEHGPTGELLYRGLRVRMGVHTGEPDCKESALTGRMDYFGPMVNRAARVAGAAKGGQLVVSGGVWREIEPHLGSLGAPAPTDLGTHSLKGLKDAERLVQLMPAELRGRTFARIESSAREQLDTSAWSKWQLDTEPSPLLTSDAPSLDVSGTLHPGSAAPLPSRLPPRAQAAPMVLELEQVPLRRQAAEAATSPSKKKRLLALLGGGVVVAAAAAGALWFGQSDHAAAWQNAATKIATQAAPELKGVTTTSRGPALLRLSSQPSGAEIVVGGKKVGVTPYVGENDYLGGKHDVVFKRAGFVVERRTFVGGEAVELHVELTPKRRQR
jgi:class 3 adenylate cyclase